MNRNGCVVVSIFIFGRLFRLYVCALCAQLHEMHVTLCLWCFVHAFSRFPNEHFFDFLQFARTSAVIIRNMRKWEKLIWSFLFHFANKKENRGMNTCSDVHFLSFLISFHTLNMEGANFTKLKIFFEVLAHCFLVWLWINRQRELS